MTSTIVKYITVPAIVVTLTLFAALSYLWTSHRDKIIDENLATAKLVGSSGTDFIVGGQPVRACLTIEPESVSPGDSLSVVLQLKKLVAPASPPCDEPFAANADFKLLGRLSHGELTPALFAAADCQVTPATARTAKTDTGLGPLVWLWGVDCKSEGIKALQVYLAFRGAPGDPTTLNFQQLKYVHVSVSPWQQILTWLTGLGTLVTVISAVAALFSGGKLKTAAKEPE